MNSIRLSAYFLLFLVVCTACNSGYRLYKKGEKRFNAGEYQLAVERFQQALAKNYSPAATSFAAAESYRLSDRIQKSAEYYQKAIEAHTSEPEAYYHYGFALKSLGKYEAASEQLALYLQSGVKNMVYAARAKKEIENLKIIGQIAAEKTYYEIQNISALNTEAAEFSPVYRNDELIFTSSRKEQMYKANGLGFLGLYRYKFDDTLMTSGSAKLFSENVHKENLNEGTPTFSKDGKTMVFARGNTGKRKSTQDVDLYISKFKDGNWTEPKMLASPVSIDSTWDSSPAFSPDGKTLYFASNRVGGYGGIDLYRTSIDAAGRVGKVTNMGADINTAGDDMFPSVSDDGKLYFSSDGHPSLGGLDLFVATRVGGKTNVRNMGIPLNSSYDDFAMVFNTPNSGFFSSNREGGKGDDDIYLFEDKTPNIKKVRYFLVGLTVTDVENKEKALDSVKVRVLDSNNKLIAETTTKADGKFGTYRLEEGKNYTIITDKPDYFTRRETFSMAGRTIPQELLTKPETDTTFEVKIRMEKIVLDKTFVVENIYYDFDKSNIRDDAAEELDKLVEFLNDNIQIKIELGSHTDSKGDDAYNLKLSQQRAESAVNYIVSKGISVGRITAKGYGEAMPIAPNENPDGSDNPDGRQENRRTEFKVLEYKR